MKIVAAKVKNSMASVCECENRFLVCVWYLIKDPDLSVDGGPRHPVTVVVEEDSLLFGVTSQRRAQLLHLVHCGVQTLLVSRLKNRRAEGKVSAWLFYS